MDTLGEVSIEVSKRLCKSEELVNMVLRCYWASVCNGIRSNKFERVFIGDLLLLRTIPKLLIWRHLRSRTEENKELYWNKLRKRLCFLDESRLIAKRDIILQLINIMKHGKGKE
jgi:hypothetical protein